MTHSGIGIDIVAGRSGRAACAGRRRAQQRQKVAMLVGAGALGATEEVIAVAERLGAGVAKALLGKAAVPDDLPRAPGRSAFSAQRQAGS